MAAVKPCAHCHDRPRQANDSYCRPCRNAYMARYMREHRSPLSPAAEMRQRARKVVGQAFARGTVARLPCQRCGGPGEVKHHPDYTKPREIVWLCRPCHTSVHRELGSWKKTPVTT